MPSARLSRSAPPITPAKLCDEESLCTDESSFTEGIPFECRYAHRPAEVRESKQKLMDSPVESLEVDTPQSMRMQRHDWHSPLPMLLRYASYFLFLAGGVLFLLGKIFSTRNADPLLALEAKLLSIGSSPYKLQSAASATPKQAARPPLLPESHATPSPATPSTPSQGPTTALLRASPRVPPSPTLPLLESPLVSPSPLPPPSPAVPPPSPPPPPPPSPSPPPPPSPEQPPPPLRPPPPARPPPYPPDYSRVNTNGPLTAETCAAMLANPDHLVHTMFGTLGYVRRTAVEPACWGLGADADSFFSDFKSGKQCNLNWYEGASGELGQESKRPRFPAGRAIALLGFEDTIWRFCHEKVGRHADPSPEHDQDVFAHTCVDGNQNILRLRSSKRPWNMCQNMLWVQCAISGRLPGQEGAKLHFATAPKSLDTRNDFPKDYYWEDHYPNNDIFYLEVCMISQLCRNSDQLFHLQAGETFVCETDQSRYDELHQLLTVRDKQAKDCAPLTKQCGGNGVSKPCCDPNAECKVINPWWHQCDSGTSPWGNP